MEALTYFCLLAFLVDPNKMAKNRRMMMMKSIQTNIIIIMKRSSNECALISLLSAAK